MAVNTPYVAYIMTCEKKTYKHMLESTYVNNNKKIADEVWSLMKECDKIGISKFKEKYSI